jgi:hypothetical protein
LKKFETVFVDWLKRSRTQDVPLTVSPDADAPPGGGAGDAAAAGPWVSAVSTAIALVLVTGAALPAVTAAAPPTGSAARAADPPEPVAADAVAGMARTAPARLAARIVAPVWLPRATVRDGRLCRPRACRVYVPCWPPRGRRLLLLNCSFS